MDQQTAHKLVELERRVDGLVRPEIPGPWQDWTPTVTQGVAVAINIDYARYATVGDTVVMVVRLTATANGTAGQPIVVAGVPAAIQPTNLGAAINTLGTALIIDQSVAWYHTAVTAAGADDFRFIAHNVTGFVGAQPNFGLVNTDVISFQACYEK